LPQICGGIRQIHECFKVGSNPVRVANSMMETDRTLIVVPTYNERENIGALIAQLLQVAPDADIVIVDDNSPDGTAGEVHRTFGTNARVSVFTRTEPRSFGGSLLDGY